MPQRLGLPCFGPVAPYGDEPVGQRRQAPELDPVLARSVKVGAARGEQAVPGGDRREATLVLGCVRSADDLDAPAAQGAELADQRIERRCTEPIARRMREHRDAAGIDDPADRVAQRRPAVRNEAGLAFDQVAAEYLAQVAANTLLDEEAREVRAADHRRIRHMAKRAFVGALDAGGRELLAHFARTRIAPAAG